MGFQQGLSGLNATSKSLEVIGNNIANANTYGTKVARAEFADVYANSLAGTGTNVIGIGTNLVAVAQQFTQGNINITDNPLDLAINGPGFFQITDEKNPVTYTRNGQFKVNADGYIVNNARLKLMGYPADAQGVIQPGQAVPLRLPTAGIEPKPTTTMDIELNLASEGKVTLPAGTPFIDFTDATTYNNATSLTVYDDKGQDVALTYYFQKAATDQWNVYLTANGTTVAGDANDPQPVTRLEFPSNGSTPISPGAPFAVDIPATTNANGAETLPLTGVMLDLQRTTQNGAAFGVTDINQNGYAPGKLIAATVELDGVVTARYSNGQSKPSGQVEVSTFRNPQGLQPLGDNAWGRTSTSGEPISGVPGEGNLGVLQPGALEESNIDLTGELVNMITAQRIYQANAQTIKTEDQILQTLVNLR